MSVTTSHPYIAQNKVTFTTNLAAKTFDIDISKAAEKDKKAITALITKIQHAFDYNCAKSMITALFVGLLAATIILGTTLVLKNFHVIHIASSQLPKMDQTLTLLGAGTGVTGTGTAVCYLAQQTKKQNNLLLLQRKLGLTEYLSFQIGAKNNDVILQEKFEEAVRNGVNTLTIKNKMVTNRISL